MLLGFGGGRRPAVSEDSPLTIVQSVPILQWCRADLGITLNGSDVSAWADQSAGLKDYTQGTASAQPAYDAAGGPNGTAIVTFDGTSDVLVASGFTLPAPGTTPTFVWLIYQVVTHTANETVVGETGSNARVEIFQSTVGNHRANNALAGPNRAGAAAGVWVRMAAFFNNATTDYLKIIADTSTGVNTGNNVSGGNRTIGSAAGGRFANMAIAEILYCAGEPSAGELAALDAYVQNRYGAGLT